MLAARADGGTLPKSPAIGGPTWVGLPPVNTTQMIKTPMQMANGGTMASRSGGGGGWLQTANERTNPLFFGPNQQMASVGPAMQMGGGGGGGGGGGRGRGGFEMAPQNPDRRIGVRVGPRSTSEWIAKNQAKGGRGLTPNYGSNLDDFYRMNPPQGPAPQNQATDDDFESTPRQDLSAFAPMANGGTMKKKGYADGGTMDMSVGQPTIVGEEGPELILPRDDGRGFVLPTDITRKILPVMRDVTPRQEGGSLPVFTPSSNQMFQLSDGSERAMIGPSGSGFAYEPQPAEQVELGETVTVQATPRMMIDPRSGYQMDMDAEGMPIIADVVTGPWAQSGMEMTPEQRQQLTESTMGEAMRLANSGGAQAGGRYPGMLFNDGYLEANMARFDAMPGETTQEKRQKVAFGNQVLKDPAIGQADGNLTFDEMNRRVAARGMEAANRRFELDEQRVQRELAARAARPSMLAGTPIGAMPGINPAVQARMDRSLERFMRTPQGMRMAMEQQMQANEGNVVGADMLPVGDSGFVPVVRDAQGRQRMAGGFIPNSRATPQMTPDQAREMGLVPVSSENGVIRYGRPGETGDEDWRVTQIEGPMVQDPSTKQMIPGPKQTVRVNARTGEFEPLRPAGGGGAPLAGGKADQQAPASGPVQVKTAADWEALPKGARYLDPSGKLKVKAS